VVSLGASSALPAVPTGRRDTKPHCTDYFPVGQSAEQAGGLLANQEIKLDRTYQLANLGKFAMCVSAA
jgi:hypothetical protein